MQIIGTQVNVDKKNPKKNHNKSRKNHKNMKKKRKIHEKIFFSKKIVHVNYE